MKHYVDPNAKVVLFEDKTFVENGVGTDSGMLAGGHMGGNNPGDVPEEP